MMIICIEIVDSAFKSRIICYRISDLHSLNEFMESVKHKIINLIKLQLQIFNAAKINCELFALFTKFEIKDDIYVTKLISFNTKNQIVSESDDIHTIFSLFVSDL